jgi:hypothetical protein
VVAGIRGGGGGCDPDAMHEEEVYSHYFYDAQYKVVLCWICQQYQVMGREEEFYIRKSKSGVFATNKETHPLWIVVFPEIIGILQSPILHVQHR